MYQNYAAEEKAKKEKKAQKPQSKFRLPVIDIDTCLCCSLDKGMIGVISWIAFVTIGSLSLSLIVGFSKNVHYVPWIVDEIFYWGSIMAWFIGGIVLVIGICTIAVKTRSAQISLIKAKP